MQNIQTDLQNSSTSLKTIESHDENQQGTKTVSKMSQSQQKLSNQSKTNCYTTISQIDEYSYLISLDSSFPTHSQRGASILDSIYSDLIDSEENLLKNEGFISITEHTIESYECRCENIETDPIESQ